MQHKTLEPMELQEVVIIHTSVLYHL